MFRFDYTKKNGKKTGRPVSAMGWLFYRDRVIIRKHTLIHIARMARKLNKKKLEKKSFPAKLCKGFISLMGWITHSDSYEWYLMYIKPYVNVKSIKRIISKLDREANKNARMERRKQLCTA